MKKHLLTLFLAVCLLAGLSGLAPVQAASEPETAVITDISGEMTWETLFDAGEYSICEAVQNENAIVAVRKKVLQPSSPLDQKESFVLTAFSTKNGEVKETATVELDSLLRKLGLADETQWGEIAKLTVIDGDIFVSYRVLEKDENYYLPAKAGLLRSEDGAHFETVAFSYVFHNLAYDVEIPGNVYLYKFREYYIAASDYECFGLCNNVEYAATYYISKDLKTWTPCELPADVYIGWPGGIYYDVLATTEKGVYFYLNPISGGELTLKEGIYVTEDFEHYTCITDDLDHDQYSLHVSPYTVLPNGKMILVATTAVDVAQRPDPSLYVPPEYEYYYTLYSYDEQTGEKEMLMDLGNVGFLCNFAGVEPLYLYMGEEESDQPVRFTAFTCQDPDGAISRTLPFPLTAIKHEHKFWEVEGKNGLYAFDTLFVQDGESGRMLISDDLWQTGCGFDCSDIVLSTFKAFFVADRIVLVGEQGVASFVVEDILSHLAPLPMTADADTDVAIRPTSKGALPEDAALKVELVSREPKITVYDIELQKGDAAIQPTYPVYVYLPIPQEREGMAYKVYRVETDGTKTQMIAETEDGRIRFATDHFSRYEVEWAEAAEFQDPAPQNPPTQDRATLWAMAGALFCGGAAALCVLRRKKAARR